MFLFPTVAVFAFQRDHAFIRCNVKDRCHGFSLPIFMDQYLLQNYCERNPASSRSNAFELRSVSTSLLAPTPDVLRSPNNLFADRPAKSGTDRRSQRVEGIDCPLDRKQIMIFSHEHV